MNTGYAKKNGEYVFVWVLGLNASECVALVTDDEAGLEEGGAKYRFTVDVLDLYLSQTKGGKK